MTTTLKIGFYGHSICSSHAIGTYIHDITSHFNATLVNIGTGRGSEERTLFELKKTTPDVAIIFHSHPRLIFMPNLWRDLDINDVNDHVLNLITNKYKGTSGSVPYTQQEQEQLALDTIPNAFELYKKHFYNPEVAINRFGGTLLMIDSYCLSKVKTVIHIPGVKLPEWFEFKSGVVLHQLSKFVTQDKDPTQPNGLSKQNNIIMRDTLIAEIEKRLIH